MFRSTNIPHPFPFDTNVLTLTHKPLPMFRSTNTSTPFKIELASGISFSETAADVPLNKHVDSFQDRIDFCHLFLRDRYRCSAQRTRPLLSVEDHEQHGTRCSTAIAPTRHSLNTLSFPETAT